MSITGSTGDICSRCCCLEDVVTIDASSGATYNLFKYPSELEQKQVEYFHQVCPTCSGTPSDSLCVGCKHMRLNHLLQCCLPAEGGTSPNSIKPPAFTLNMGSVREMRERSSSCHTCDLVGEIANRLIETTGHTEDSSCYIMAQRAFTTMSNIQCNFLLTVGLWDQEYFELSVGLWNREHFELSVGLWNREPPRACDSHAFIGTVDPLRGNQLVSIRIPNALIDWKLVFKWLEDCNGTSGQADSCYMKPELEFFRELRVVDVKKRRIIMAPAFCEYAALSYVWGDSSGDQLQATTKNIEFLCTEGYLSSARLPQVIDDAIFACEILSINYIWVDRLCILQDEDPTKKERFLSAMGDIYRNSYLTLVALAGIDAQYGLPGVNRVVRPALWTRQTQGLYLIDEPFEPQKSLVNSRWFTRGWTFQEGMLASRLLYFTNKGVFYECCHRKEVIQDEICGPVSGEPQYERDERQAYRQAVWKLTDRDLSWESDILNAFKGVLHSRWGDHYHGLPLRIFSDAIFWTLHEGPMFPRTTIPGQKFPSWSWCSVRDTVLIDGLDITSSEWKKKRSSLATWAIPYVSDGQATLRLVSNASGEPAGFCESQSYKSVFECRKQDLGKANLESRTTPISDPLCETSNPISVHLQNLKDAYALPRIAAVLAWKHGCFSAPIPSQLNMDGTWEDYEKIVSKEWSSLAQFCDEAHCMPKGIMSKQNTGARFPPEMWHKYTTESIFVYTQSLPVKLTFLDEMDEISIGIQADELIPEIVLGSVNMERIEGACNQDSPAVFNVIALSVRSFISKKGVSDEYVWYDSEGTMLNGGVADPIKVELMIIATENGLSQRVGLAEVFLKAWVNKRPQFNTFHLI